MRAFGQFELDSRTGELTRNGIRVRLQPLQAKLLILLTSQPGRIYSREEICEELWSGQSYGNFDQSLNFAVSQLRSALLDSAEVSRYIETIPKRGYRFVASIRESERNDQSAVLTGFNGPAYKNGHTAESKSSEIPAIARLLSAPVRNVSIHNRIRYLVLAFVLFAALASAAWWLFPLQPPRAVRYAQITTAGAIDFLVKPVSDGTRVYYVERVGGHWEARQTSLLGGESQTMPGLPHNMRVMDLSPNRATWLLGQFTSRSSQSTLWLMPVQGGVPARFGNIVSGEAVWHPDGNHIVYAQGHELWIVGIDASDPRRLVSLPGDANWLAWSPDGRRLRLTVGDHNGGVALWEMQQDGSRLHRVFPNDAPDLRECCGEWTPDGRYFIYSAGRRNAWSLWAARDSAHLLRRAPSGPFQLTGFPGNLFGAHVAGNSVFFYAGRYRDQVLSFSVTDGRLVPLSPEGFSEPEYSRDGRWIAFVDMNTGAVWKDDVVTSQRVRITPEAFNSAFPRWSPDGTTVAAVSSRIGELPSVWLFPADGSAPQKLLPGQQETSDPDWSPDGTTLVVVHAAPVPPNEESLFLVDRATGAETLVPGSAGHFFPHWSPDGRYLAAYADSEREVDLYDFTTQKWTTVARATAIGYPAWSSDSQYLYYQRTLDEGEPVVRYSVRTRRTEPVTNFTAELAGGISRCAFLGVAPNGTLLVDLTRGLSDLYRADLLLPK
jgi:Tol biopolymer transport system component/DNA-binding winged helix-turn-helix (wHTH) protein